MGVYLLGVDACGKEGLIIVWQQQRRRRRQQRFRQGPTLQPVAYMLAWRMRSGAADTVGAKPWALGGSRAGSARSLMTCPWPRSLADLSLALSEPAVTSPTETIGDAQKHST